MADIFFSKNKNNPEAEASDQNTADITEAVEYCREQYYSNQQDIYSDGIPMSKPYQPPYNQNGYQVEIPTYQLPDEQPVYYQQPESPQYFQQPENEPPEKKKHKKTGILRFIVTVISIVAIIVGGTAGSVFFVASTVDYNKVDLESNPYIAASDLNSSKRVYNILFLGVDGTDNSNSLRSDSMMLVSIDAANKKIKLTSFLRDSWVEIPSKGKKAKLNAAFSYGGAQLAVDTIEYNFHIDIDHYVMVNFDMFTQIIDSLGGIEVEVTEKEARFINKTTRHTVESGENVLLNGAEALVYCRIRKLDSDYMRTFRQRKVITALINRAKESELAELYETVTAVFPLIQTDMSAGELTQLFFKAGFALVAYSDIQQTQAPIEEHFKAGYTSGGQWAEFIDLEAVREYLYKFIYTDEINTEENAE